MLIPIFGSCPSHLNGEQDEVKRMLLGELGRVGLEWRSIGQTDYPTKFPLLEVFALAKHCSGGLILGFSQFETNQGIWKKDTPYEKKQKGRLAIPTPWNQLEAGILFSLRTPLLVFRDPDVAGGIFDVGVTDLFIHEMPKRKLSTKERKALREVFQRWSAEVITNYHNL